MPAATFSFQVGKGLDSAERARSCFSLSRRSFLPNFFTEWGLQCTTLSPLGKRTSCLLCSLCLSHVCWHPIGQRSSGKSLDSVWKRNIHKKEWYIRATPEEINQVWDLFFTNKENVAYRHYLVLVIQLVRDSRIWSKQVSFHSLLCSSELVKSIRTFFQQ